MVWYIAPSNSHITNKTIFSWYLNHRNRPLMLGIQTDSTLLNWKDNMLELKCIGIVQKMQIVAWIPSLNTQYYIEGLFMVRDFCFWAVWAAESVHKKKLAADYEQLLRVVFHVLGVKMKIKLFFRASNILKCECTT